MSGTASAPRFRHHRPWQGHGLNNRWIFGLLVSSCRRIPAPLLRGLSRRLVMPVTAGCLRKVRRGVEANLAVILPASSAAARRRLARETFQQYGLSVVDLFQAAGRRSFQRLAGLIEDPVAHRTLRALGSSNGAILVSPHLGNWELGALALSAAGMSVRLVALPERDPGVEHVRQAMRRAGGVETIPVGSTLSSFLRVRKALSEGCFVAMLCDRHFEEDRCPVSLLGREAQFLRSPALLAAASGAPMVPVAVVRLPDGRYRILLGDPVEVTGEGNAQAEVVEAMGRVALSFGRFISSFPTQWYNFFAYWPEAPPAAHAPVRGPLPRADD